MFERYTEKARRVIFYARFEASQFGSPFIETEHLLLGILREDKDISHRYLGSQATFEALRKQVEQHTTIRELISTSVDLPLSNESKRVLAYAAEEAETLAHKHIGTEHLLLGLLREEKSFAAELLRERGLRLASVREELAKATLFAVARGTSDPGAPSEWFTDLTQAAAGGHLSPLIGRDLELDTLIEILGRRYRRNALLVGARGAGKTAIVEGLAQRIAHGQVPQYLANKKILVWRSEEIRIVPRRRLDEIIRVAGGGDSAGEIIVFLEELQYGDIEGGNLRRILPQAGVQCVGALQIQNGNDLARANALCGDWFQALHVSELNEVSTLAVLSARKSGLEGYHGVTYSEEALVFAVHSAATYLPGHVLPGKAIELFDATGARAKLHRLAPPAEIQDAETRLRAMTSRMESAIANHEFERARFYSDEERKERHNLQELRAKHSVADASSVEVKDLKEVITTWGAYPYC
jgi:ATP-dependent Clp protease ATP-binding subunit ClpC